MRLVEVRRRRRTSIWRRAAVLAALSVAALPARALTIEEALAEAARSNPTLHAAREAARSRHEDVSLALAGWLPTIEASAGARIDRTGSASVRTGQELHLLPVVDSDGRPVDGRFVVGSTPTFGTASRESDSQSMELVWTQNVFRSGRDQARLRRADEDVLRSHANVERTEQEVFLRVAGTYLDVLRAERTVALREASLAAFEARVRETRAQFRVGDRTRADLAQADAERQVAAAEVVAARADLEAFRARFETLVGVPPGELKVAGEPANLPETLEAARLAARGERPTVRAAEHAVRAAEHAVRAAAAELGPRIDVRGAITRTVGSRRGAPDSTDASVGVQLTMPLWQAGAGGARLRQARHVRAQRRGELLAARRDAWERATSSWRNLSAARQRHAALTAAADASRTALAGIRREAGIGERTTREVLDAERDLVSRQVRALSAERDSVVAAYELLEATGALTARRLGIGNVPDLGREAREARAGRWLVPGLLSPGAERAAGE